MVKSNTIIIILLFLILLFLVLIYFNKGFNFFQNNDSANSTTNNQASFKILVLNSRECTSCDTSFIVDGLKNLFPGVNVEEKDVKDVDQNLLKENGITKLPAFLFEEAVAKTNSWASNPEMALAFDKVGYGYKLKDEVGGASFFVDEKERKAHYEKLGVVKGDNLPEIDFFVMSYCPYGNDAEEALKIVFDKLNDKAVFDPHYVIYSNYAGGGKDYCFHNSSYCSMHGVAEMNQGLRELCVKDIYGMNGFFNFVIEMNDKCDYKNADACWQNVAKGLGYDDTKIQKCFDDKALEMAGKELYLNKLFGAGGSPAVFIDGDIYSGPRTPKDYMIAVCNNFENPPEECKNLSDLPSTGSSSTGAGCEV